MLQDEKFKGDDLKMCLLSLDAKQRKEILNKSIDELKESYKDSYVNFDFKGSLPDPYGIDIDDDREDYEDLFLMDALNSPEVYHILEERGLVEYLNEFETNEVRCKLLELDLLNPFYSPSEMVVIGLLVLDLRRLIIETNSLLKKDFDSEEIEEFYQWFVKEKEEENIFKDNGVFLLSKEDIYSMLSFLVLNDSNVL